MLSPTLKELEKYEIILRRQFSEIPPYVEYSFTERGKKLALIFYEIEKWVKEV